MAAAAAAPAHDTVRYPRHSESGSGSLARTDGFRAVDRRATPVLENGMGVAHRSSSVLSPSREGENGDDDDEEEDSFGGPGLTVEAYMATKKRRHQSNVRSLSL